MARIRDIRNEWGRKGGPNPQRTDLFQVDLSKVISGLNGIEGMVPKLPDIPRYFASAITLPELKIGVEKVMRDSRTYNTPGMDEPLDSIKITFVMDDGGKRDAGDADASQSTIYTIMDVWRAVVRSGRGAMGTEPSFTANGNYKVVYAFPVYVYLLKGQLNPSTAFTTTQVKRVNINKSTLENTFEGGFVDEELVTATQVMAVNQTGFPIGYSGEDTLPVAGIYELENCWLAGFKIQDLNYEKAGVLHLDATLYADNILQVRRLDTVPSFL